jgi:cellulose synthase/poly-beta-1,6-N-acetylglucosamine synthase-like glycosyltransferase
MSFWEIVFYASVLLVFYNYAGYALIVYVLNKLKKNKEQPAKDHFPTVSFIVAAFNEEDCIEKKIANSLELYYPRERIEYIFITDGSSDGTTSIIRRFPAVQLLHRDERAGKSAALNRAVSEAKNDILIFSDANTILNTDAIRNITRHYADARVGGVAGEKKVISASAGSNEVGQGEGAYWKYESTLKKLDSRFYSVVGAAGELFSLRRNLYEAVERKVILDDFVISMRVAQKGFRIVYEPDAYAMELPSFSMQDEGKRKVRIAAGGFQALGMLGPSLAFWKNPRLSFLYISHRVMRWTVSPLCLILAFIANLILVIRGGSQWYTLLLIGQVLFYGAAVAAVVIHEPKGPFKLFRLAYYFVFMNLSVVQGFFRFLRGRQPATWEKARRMQPSLNAKS